MIHSSIDPRVRIASGSAIAKGPRGFYIPYGPTFSFTQANSIGAGSGLSIFNMFNVERPVRVVGVSFFLNIESTGQQTIDLLLGIDNRTDAGAVQRDTTLTGVHTTSLALFPTRVPQRLGFDLAVMNQRTFFKAAFFDSGPAAVFTLRVEYQRA